MGQKKRLGLTGPFLFAFGGVTALFPVLSFVKMLFEGRILWPYESAFIGMSTWTLVFVFLGLLMMGLGLEEILESSKNS
ncbi:hypothetical protein EU527_14515 [Candidatus Thorarchaeota archaeon]|nr:MAG: hypothetical protein EU527_14515 [Candidatus Thorarchaeota archaeon]